MSFHLTLALLYKTLNLVKKMKMWVVLCRGFMFNDNFVKIVLNFEIKLFFHCLVTFGFQKSLLDC